MSERAPDSPRPTRSARGNAGDDGRPMSVFLAVAWTGGVTVGTYAAMLLVASLRSGAGADAVTPFFCELAIYGLGLFAILRVHGPEAPIRDFAALRAVHPALYPLGLVFGASLSLPAGRLYDWIRELWPPSSPLTFDDAFLASPAPERALIAVAVMLLIPIAEEVFFRGALFGRLRQHRRPLEVVALTSLLFAVAHVEPRQVLAILPVAMCLGFLRHVSGSAIPTVLAHVAFNSLSVGLLLGYAQASEQIDIPVSWELLSLGAAIASAGAIAWLGLREQRLGHTPAE